MNIYQIVEVDKKVFNGTMTQEHIVTHYILQRAYVNSEHKDYLEQGLLKPKFRFEEEFSTLDEALAGLTRAIDIHGED